MSPHVDQFDEREELAHEVVIPSDEWGEVRFARRVPDDCDLQLEEDRRAFESERMASVQRLARS